MFQIKDLPFPSDAYGMEAYLNNWPMLYILENGKYAYVGQTNSINHRMIQHKESESKKLFNRVHIIYSDKFTPADTQSRENTGGCVLYMKNEKFETIFCSLYGKS